jgi:hypothetical protein
MSIMDMFRSAKPTQPLQVAENTNKENLDAKLAEAAKPDENPMDKFNELWAAPKEGDPVAPSFDPSKMFQIDPAKIQEEVSKINFAGSVTKEQLAAIQAGGDDATAAFAAAMNSVAQQTFAQSMLASAKLVEGAMTQANNTLDARIAQEAKKLNVSSSLRETNPALSHPAAEPLVKAMEAQFAQKHPNASSSELTKMAQEYLATFANVAAGKKDEPTPKGASKEFDFSNFLE